MAKEKKYKCVSRVVHVTHNKTYHPGEIAGFTPKAAGILLKMGVIEPIEEKNLNKGGDDD
jgi:hypothetical protein